MFGSISVQFRVPYWPRREADVSLDVSAHSSYVKSPRWPSLTFWRNQYEKGMTFKMWLVFVRLFFKIDCNIVK